LNRNLPAVFALLTAVILVNRHNVCAADTPATGATAQSPASSAPTSQVPDKWQYTLVNPVPAGEMREMVTDRPNIANSPFTIDAGHLQIETGIADYTYYQSSSTPFTSWDFGDFNFRLGVLNNLEINAEVTAYEENITQFHSFNRTLRDSSVGDTYLGGKLNFWGNDSSQRVWGTGLGIQPQFKIPTASDDVGNGKFEFKVLLPFSVSLPADFTLSVQPGIDYLRNQAQNSYTYAYEQAFCVDRVFFKRLDLYVEYAFALINEPHSKSEQLIDFGGIYQLRSNIALDTGIEFGLNRASPTVAATVGVSVRF
jgi:Putative MetA-pathway of phenol degradation